MNEYIEREAALAELRRYGLENGSSLGHHSGAVECAERAIQALPAAKVAPIVEGRWLCGDDEQDDWFCSECKTPVAPADCPETPYEMGQKFCYNCGARMMPNA